MRKVKCTKYGEGEVRVGSIYNVIDEGDFTLKITDEGGFERWVMKDYFDDVEDVIVESVLESFQKRSKVGKDKYGVTMDRTDLKLSEWLQHLQEELMDATLYVEKLKQSL